MDEQEREQDDTTRRSVLRGTIGLSVVGVTAVAYDRMARTPNWETVDIQVGNGQNSVDLRETVTVSMVSSAEDGFHPTEWIDSSNVTVRFAIYRRASHPDNAVLLDAGASPLHESGHAQAVTADGIDDLTFHFDACDAFVEDEIFEGDMYGRLLVKEDWSFTEEKDGWRGDVPVRIVGGSCN